MPKTRMPGMAATKSYAIPRCTVHTDEQMTRDDAGNWFCLTCADAWLKGFVEAKTGDKSQGGVKLPWGVRDERKKAPSFRDLHPNRRARRRAK